MENLELDIGLREYVIPGGGVLRFNPADPGLYGRFSQAAGKLQQMETELSEKGKGAAGEELLALMQEADRRAKALLGETFGGGNDFDRALGGVSLLAVCGNGKTVAENLLCALGAQLEAGARQLVEQKLAAAKENL